MKKFLAIMLALAIMPCAVLLTGCGNKTASITVIGSDIGLVTVYIGNDEMNIEKAGKFELKKGKECTLYAFTHERGLGKFVGWSDGNTENPRDISVDKDIKLTAYFRPLATYHLELLSDIGGCAKFWPSFNICNQVLKEGYSSWSEDEMLTLVAYPDEGYVFTGWSDGETETTRYLQMDSNKTIKACFEPIN